MSHQTEFFNSLLYIRDNMMNLSRTEQIIAKHILEQPEAFLHDTLKMNADRMEVSEGSIVNFSRKLGFKGFSEMKLNIAQCITPFSRPVTDDAFIPDQGMRAIAYKLMKNVIHGMQATCEHLSEELLQTAVNAILRASHIEVYGLGTSGPPATHLYTRLIELGMPAKLVTDLFYCAVSAETVRAGDLVIAISASGITHDLMRAVKTAKQHGATVLCFTSSQTSALAQSSDICILSNIPYGKASNFTHEINMAFFFLIEAICTNLAVATLEEANERQNKLDAMWIENFHQ